MPFFVKLSAVAVSHSGPAINQDGSRLGQHCDYGESAEALAFDINASLYKLRKINIYIGCYYNRSFPNWNTHFIVA